SLLTVLKPGDLIAGKSTVPVGTAARLADKIDGSGATLVWNPEFLREGWAVKDTIEPDRLVVGVPVSDGADGSVQGTPSAEGERAADILREVYAPAVATGT